MTGLRVEDGLGRSWEQAPEGWSGGVARPRLGGARKGAVGNPGGSFPVNGRCAGEGAGPEQEGGSESPPGCGVGGASARGRDVVEKPRKDMSGLRCSERPTRMNYLPHDRPQAPPTWPHGCLSPRDRAQALATCHRAASPQPQGQALPGVWLFVSLSHPQGGRSCLG